MNSGSQLGEESCASEMEVWRRLHVNKKRKKKK